MKKLNKRWLILNQIDKGGQGKVFKVQDITGKHFAAKVFTVKQFQEQKLARIKTEIEIIKKLKDSTNVVTVYDDNLDTVLKDKTQSEIFYIMDYSKFGSLANNDFFINDVELGLRLFKEILIGVSNAHKKNVIHRDLKPENIILYPTQRKVIITDFGLGLLKDRSLEKEVTKEDEVLGPVYFMSPEQFKNPSKVDERSDIYSLGKILFYILTGKGKLYREDIGDLSLYYTDVNPYLPLIQENILSKMVVYDQEKRFIKVEEVIEEVDKILEDISANSKRYIKKKENNINFYNIFIEKDKEKFIANFSKNLIGSANILEWSLEDLYKQKRVSTAQALVNDLLKKYPKGRYYALINSVSAFISEPTKLKTLEYKYKKYSFPNYYLSKYFYNAKSFKNAHIYLEKALLVATESEIKLEYLLFFGAICKQCKCDNKHDFDMKIKELLRQTKQKEEKTKLYKTLGVHYIETGEIIKGLKFLEAYLEYEPYDQEIRFKCGYQYFEIENYSSSLYHYLIYKNNSKEEGHNAINNLGVIYDRKEMPIKQMEMHQQAFKEGNTLAGSNIASMYLSIGLVDEAKKLLRKIIKENDYYDERVDEVLGRIATKIKEEEDTEKQMTETGERINDYHINYIKQLFSNENYSWIGIWSVNKHLFEVKDINGEIKFTSLEDSYYKINGNIEGNCIEIKELQFSYLTTNTEGVLYLLNNDTIKGYTIENKKLVELLGTRINDINKYYENNPSLKSYAASLSKFLPNKN